MNQPENRIESTLLRRINERRLLEVIQQQGPSSRAALTRVSGLTAPTVSKVVDSLLTRGFVEELDPVVPALGRPGRLVRMAVDTATVLGVVIDAETCCVAATGLDGLVTEARTRRFPTPATYGRLSERIARECRALLDASSATPLGVGVSVPGLVNERLKEVVLSPNLHILDKRNPALDLELRLGVKCLLLQETDGLCLAERPADFAPQIDTVTEYLAIAIAAVINICNPTALIVHGSLIAASEERFARVLERVRQRTLTASLADCTIKPTRSSKRQGAVAGIIHHLTQAWAPAIR